MEHLKIEWTGIQQKHRLYKGEGITVQGYFLEELFIDNYAADNHFSYYIKKKTLIYRDGNNIFTTPKGMVLWEERDGISFERPGDSLNFEDGGIGCVLEEKDIREMLEASFFLPHQLRFYDFIKDELLLLKW